MPHDRYAIRVAGQLGATALAGFPEFDSETDGSQTTLSGELSDPSELYRALGQLEALGLEVIDIHRPAAARASGEMTAMFLSTDYAMGLAQRPWPEPSADQVLIDVDLCGICGSDLHAAELRQVYRGGFIFGHEPVGRVAAVGENVTGWRIGQRVAINPNGDTCGVCEYCLSGRFNFCAPATMERAIGLQTDGALAPQVVVSPKTLHAVPDHMGRVESAWVEPAATALRGVRLAGHLEGRSVLVVGGGPIGHVSARIARHLGAARVWMSEPSEERRRFAEASRVDSVFDPLKETDVIERLEVDVVLECSGNEAGARSGLAALAPQGSMVILGGATHPGLDPLAILLKEVRVKGSFIYVNEFEEMIAMLAGGSVQVADLTTDIVGVEDAPRAFERLREASTMKILTAPNGP